MNKEWWNNQVGQIFGDEIIEELHRFKGGENMLRSLEMQIIMSFMEKKRKALNDLLQIMESKKGQNEVLERKVNQGIIT